MELLQRVIEKLKRVYDPEIPVDIYNLGLIYDIGFEKCSKGYYCNITMTFTTPYCPIAEYLFASVNQSVSSIEEIYKVSIKLTFDPPWSPNKISDEGKDVLRMDNLGFL